MNMGRKKEMSKRIFVLLVVGLFLNWPIVNALSISNVQATNITADGSVIEWDTDTAADSFVYYGDNKSDLTSIGDSKSVENHSITLSSLTNSTTYYYKVKSGSTEDNNSESLYSFTTLSEASTVTSTTQTKSTAPTITASVPDTVSVGSINVSGTTSTKATVTLKVNGKTVITQGTVSNAFKFLNVKLESNLRNNLVIDIKDDQGNTNSKTLSVYCNLRAPKIYLQTVPAKTNESSITLTGTISKNVSLEISVNNKSTHKLTTDKFSKSVNLKEGQNEIKISAVDDGGLKDEVTKSVYADTKLPTIKATLSKGNSYYQGRAETDITGTTKPGAKVYLYYFKRDVYQTTPDFGKAVSVVTADKEGKFTFSDINLEKTPFSLKKLAPKQIPASLKDVVLPPLTVISGKTYDTYDVYLLVEDQMDRVGTYPWKQTITIYTCYTADYAFHVDPMVEFQLPYRLDPELLDEGRQVISSIINLSYVGSGVSTATEKGFKIIGTPKIEKACTPGMVTSGGFSIACKVLPSVVNMKGNSEGTAWFLQSTLAQTKDLSKKSDDFWNTFQNSQLKFPLKITVSFQEKGLDGKWSATKSQTSCFDLGYFVDVPLDSKQLVPDFLANEGVDALNATISAIDVVLPYLEKAMLVTGIACGVSIVAKLVIRWYRIFMSKLEGYKDTLSSKKKEEKCPVGDAQNALVLESTAKGKGWGGITLTDETSLDKRCPSTAKAWGWENKLNSALRWTCDRFFCHEAPAEWTKDKDEGTVMTAKLKEQSCGSQASQGVPLREIKDCKKHIESHPEEFHSSIRKDETFLKKLSKSSGNTCYVDGNGYVYYIDEMSASDVKDAQDRRLWKLSPIGSRGGIAVGQILQKNKLVAYKPDNSDNFITGIDDKCDAVCKKKTGYKKADCYIVDNKGELDKSNPLTEGMYVAGYTEDCFPKQTTDPLRTCVCQQDKTIKGGTTLRTAAPEEEWSYRQAQLYSESGGNKDKCTGGKYGTCYPSWRYYSGRDLSAAFGANYLLDFSDEVTEVNPFTQHVGAFQTLCLSGIYNRLKMLQSILMGIKNCLIEAKYTGLTSAGQCKAIFSQAVCGLLYKLIVYASQGCLSLPFGDVGKKGDESVWAKGVGFGIGAVKDTLDTTMTDLKSEYGNANMNQLFQGGAQGVIKNICLAAFGYDWPYGIDFLMDSAYRVPMKTTALVVPAERELVSYNPTIGTAIFSYRIGASIFPGCKIRSYSVKLKCIDQGDMGNENVNCPDPVYESCPCLYASGSYTDKEKTIYTDVKGISSGSYISIPLQSPQVIDSVFKYDHAIIELQLDQFEDATKCAESQYLSGSKLVFYAPITDVSGKPLVACKADAKTGKFSCPELSNFFGEMGGIYFQSPYVQCYNARTQTFGNCNSLNAVIKGETIRIKPNLYTSGRKQCLHITMTGMPSTKVISIPENVGPTYTPEIDLMVVTDSLLGGLSGYNLVTSDSSGATCSPSNLGQVSGGTITAGTYTFSYTKGTTTGTYILTLPSGVTVETSGYANVNNKLQKLSGGTTDLTATEIQNTVFKVGGFRISKIMVIPSAGTSGSCKYEVKSTSTSVSGQNVRNLDLKLDLKYPINGDCIAATQPVKSAIGQTSVRETVKIQEKVTYVGVGLTSGLYTYWTSGNYKSILDKVESILSYDNNNLDDALAYYYGAAASIMIGSQSSGSTQTTYYALAGKYATLFDAKKSKYGTTITSTEEYQKIEKYMSEIKGKYSSS